MILSLDDATRKGLNDPGGLEGAITRMANGASKAIAGEQGSRVGGWQGGRVAGLRPERSQASGRCKWSGSTRSPRKHAFAGEPPREHAFTGEQALQVVKLYSEPDKEAKINVDKLGAAIEDAKTMGVADSAPDMKVAM